MKVTALETIHIDEFPNLLWVHVHTDEGIVGLGETFFGVRAAEAHIHEVIAPYLIGKDPRRIDLHSAKMVGYLGFHGSSAEQRARSAVDIALWDLWGKAAGQPVCQMLGGAVRDDIRIYNTCAGNRYAIENPVHGTHNFGLEAKAQQFEDLHAFLNDAGELAHSLLEMGITGMKIWPFDFAAEASNGSYISAAELDKALEPFRKIREAVGGQMDVMAELHGLWNLQSAKKLCGALEEFNPLWIEDPVFLDQLDSIGQVQASTSAMIGTGEILGGRGQFLELFQNGGCGMAITDLSWCGGISEARKIGTMAEAFHVNVAFHDCTGPVVLAASTHLALNARNCFIQEMVRAYYYNWYGTLVTALPPIADGRITVTDAPGLGLELNADRLKAKDVQVRRSG